MDQSATLLVAQKKIPFAKVCCEGNELAYLKEVLDSGWLTTAGKARAFEERFAAAVGTLEDRQQAEPVERLWDDSKCPRLSASA